MRVDETASGSEQRLRLGEVLEVALAETRTAGYRWRIVADGAPACRVEADRPEPPGTTVPGAPGRRVFRFVAVARGTGLVELRSERSFGGGAPSRRFTLRIVVEG